MKYLLIFFLLACGKTIDAAKPPKPGKQKVYVVHLGVAKYYCKEFDYSYTHSSVLQDCELDGDPSVTIEKIYNATNVFESLK